MAFAGWRPLALDVFDRPETLAALWDRLVQGYAMDALTDEPASVGEEFAYGFLKGIARDDAEATSHEGVGLGIDVILTSSNSVADALTWEGAVVHLAAFPRATVVVERFSAEATGRATGSPGRAGDTHPATAGGSTTKEGSDEHRRTGARARDRAGDPPGTGDGADAGAGAVARPRALRGARRRAFRERR